MATEKAWISLSDVMSVLMMIFLFIAIVFMLKVEEEQQQLQAQHSAVRSVAAAYDEARNGLHETLQTTLANDLPQWDAMILPNGGIRFRHPDVLFAVGESALSAQFRERLRAFFPRYVRALRESAWAEAVSEIRIEGHTSSDWHGERDDDKYIANAQLAGARAQAVLAYVYQLPAVASERAWLERVLRANGLAYARPVLVGGVEDAQQSRRVEFHAIIDSAAHLANILRLTQAHLQ